jgi:hypothetical protein
MKFLIPTTYFGNIEYFSKLLQADEIHIENHEHFIKQTYRNRCEIYGANGKLDLIVPIKRGRTERTIMNKAEIDYTSNWQKLHWRSIESGYRRSPYFEYYEDKFQPFFEKKYDLLIDLNLEIIQFILKLLKENKNIQFTSEYEKSYPNIMDYRSSFEPKLREKFKHDKYVQVFENKFGFYTNLSILDLLFNCGPEGVYQLKKT